MVGNKAARAYGLWLCAPYFVIHAANQPAPSAQSKSLFNEGPGHFCRVTKSATRLDSMAGRVRHFIGSRCDPSTVDGIWLGRSLARSLGAVFHFHG